MKHFISQLFLGALFVMQSVYAQNPSPAKPQSKSILINNVTVHDGNAKVYTNASVGFNNGKITFLSYQNTNDTKPNFDSIIDGNGKHLYPGLIALNTIIGIAEIEALRAMNDYAEVGSINPSSRALIAYNTDSKVTPTIRSNGILTAQITPQGGIASGTSSIVELDAWNWEDAALKADDGLHINWPNMRMYHSFTSNEREEYEKRQKTRIEKETERIEQLFADAYAYSLTPKNNTQNLNLEAMRGIFDGSKKLYIHADYSKEIIAAINLCNTYKIKFTLVGGADSYLLLNLLKENNVSVVLGRDHALPMRDDEDIDLPYKLPKILKDAGILFAISCDGFWQVRNLPFMAGTAAAYGLSKEEALQTITLNAAKITGIDQKTGSIDLNKDATLLLTSGDLLDMKSSSIDAAFIEGKLINLDNVQHQLYKKYQAKYGLK